MDKEQTVLEVRHLKKYYSVGRKQLLRAVDDVSFCIYRGEVLGIVGESGCGKTTCGKTCLGMLDKTGGDVFYEGQNVHRMSRKERFQFTKKVQMIFQDPYASLDPQQKVYSIIAEGIQIHKMASGKVEEEKMVLELLEMVGLNTGHMNRHIHEFSGGQRQRIGIARALAVNPEFLLCDEPVSALDVSIQAQIINLLVKLQKEKKLTMLFIAHDISIVKHISDRIGVMYQGKLFEIADSQKVYKEPLHPYTKALFQAVPTADPELARKRKKIVLKGDATNPVHPPKGCRFCERCASCMNICHELEPKMREVLAGHWVACHIYNEVDG